VIEAKGIVKAYRDGDAEVRVLDGLDLAVKDGELVAVVGPSGSGKSTLLHLLGGLDADYRGEISVNGARLTGLPDRALAAFRGSHLGFVFQSFHLVPSLTAAENVMLPLELAGRRDARTAAMETLRRVGLEHRTGHYPRQLSGGEQQRVAIARAFVTRPAVLFADEPTGNLDTHTGERIVSLLFDLNAQSHTTLVLVTHDRAVASRCGRVLQMDSGRLA
jgi:putative ABC transport system ATP-binding protein